MKGGGREGFPLPVEKVSFPAAGPSDGEAAGEALSGCGQHRAHCLPAEVR